MYRLRMGAWAALLLCLLPVASTGADLTSGGFGPMRKGRTTFYGGEPDKKDPNEPSWGTQHGSCGCVSCCASSFVVTTSFNFNSP